MSIGRKQYPFDLIEPKWQAIWDQQQVFRAWNPGEPLPPEHPFALRHNNLAGDKTQASELPPKYYVLDMFPYPSGAGLHVGHPEGYTATDILARYRRAAGFNVLHPMGWDAFGLPAEQYAVKTGQHPRQTTEANIATFKRQIKSLGFSYDWSREVDTTDPKYFKWTQWIFLKLYNSWFNPETNKAEPIETLPYPTEVKTEEEKRAYVDSKRLAYVAELPVWWCEGLGTVLANEEVVDGKSEVGDFPVIRKPMKQWVLRITAYADRLLDDLATIDWTDSLKKQQFDWIGRSEGAEVDFPIAGSQEKIRVFTTRPDTLFGATYIVLAPEHPLVALKSLGGIVPDQTPMDHSLPFRSTYEEGNYFAAISKYVGITSTKSERDRGAAKEKTGQFTGAFAINPVNGEKIPIYIADYVLSTYGTGAIMAVPAHDERDWEFAKKFGLSIEQVVIPHGFVGGAIGPMKKAFCEEGLSFQSPPSGWRLKDPSGERCDINGLPTPEAKKKITAWLEEKGLGKKTVNYKLRDWLFSRQRYWGEPFPIIWKRDANGNLQHEALPESALPLLPPKLDDYKPTADGQPPLARAKDWMNLPDGSIRETNTMPQWAGSCWYYLRFLDAQNSNAFVGKDAETYWMGMEGPRSKVQGPKSTPGVDLYVGGTEHAVLHLLYARFWHKVLFDLGYVSTPEPFFKLVNQGLILGEDGQKMSKSRGNVVNPDDILKDYGADAFRLYEMFLGPLEMVKPWNTKGVEGVYRFLGRVWRLFVDETSETEFEQQMTAESQRGAELLATIHLSPAIQDVVATPAQLKALHATIKKVTEDLDGLRFNTAISALMVFINEAMTWEVKPVSALREFLILLQPFAPHLAEELWGKLSKVQSPRSKVGEGESVSPESMAYATWPKFDLALLVESTLEIPVQVNGKLRDKLVVPADASKEQLEAAAVASEKVKPFIEGKIIKKIIIVPMRLVNIVIG